MAKATTKCPNCSGDWKTVDEGTRTIDVCKNCGYKNSDSIVVKDSGDKGPAAAPSA